MYNRKNYSVKLQAGVLGSTIDRSVFFKSGSVKCQVNKPVVEQILVYFTWKIYTRIPYMYNWRISSFPATIISGLRGGLHTGPHQVEATARLKKEMPLEAAWEGVLSWEALRLLMERNPDEASADPPSPPPGGLRPQEQSVLAQA